MDLCFDVRKLLAIIGVSKYEMISFDVAKTWRRKRKDLQEIRKWVKGDKG